MGMPNLNDIFGKALGGRTQTRRMTVADSYDVLVAEGGGKPLDEEQVALGVRSGRWSRTARVPGRD